MDKLRGCFVTAISISLLSCGGVSAGDPDGSVALDAAVLDAPAGGGDAS